jgi:hypothetical protein
MHFKRGDFIKEGFNVGLVFASGPKTFDVIWDGGSTSRYRHGERIIVLAPDDALTPLQRKLLLENAADAREERRTGAGVKRGQIWPSR